MAVSDPNELGKLATTSLLALMIALTWLWVGGLVWAVMAFSR
jgi:hypothetical protein